jgi:DNA invertase Pin-like site-specific DNA recombinase
MGAVNEFQVNIQREKQLEGIALAKEQGKYKGRKKVEVTDKLRELYEQWKHREITKKEIMDITGLARTTLHRRFKDIEEEQS